MVKKSILAKVGDKINYKLIRDGYKTGKGNVVVTAEMDTKSTITADVPSTSYASNLDYDLTDKGIPFGSRAAICHNIYIKEYKMYTITDFQQCWVHARF